MFLARPLEDNHVVQFYEDDASLCDTLAHFVGAGLIGGEPVVVIGTPGHREAFDLFVQGYRTSDRGQGGLGIGLALVRNLASLHHGTVVALSEGEGKGSEFVVRLPAVPHARVEAQAVPTPEKMVDAAQTATPRRILVVDDNEDAALLLSEMLAGVGHEVVVAHDGPEALSLIERFTPDIAVLDIGLPVMDGYELASKLRERLSSAPPRMMAVTGYGQDHDRERSRAAGFELHFVKPLHPEKLIAAIEAPPSRSPRRG